MSIFSHAETQPAQPEFDKVRDELRALQTQVEGGGRWENVRRALMAGFDRDLEELHVPAERREDARVVFETRMRGEVVRGSVEYRDLDAYVRGMDRWEGLKELIASRSPLGRVQGWLTDLKEKIPGWDDISGVVASFLFSTAEEDMERDAQGNPVRGADGKPKYKWPGSLLVWLGGALGLQDETAAGVPPAAPAAAAAEAPAAAEAAHPAVTLDTIRASTEYPLDTAQTPEDLRFLVSAPNNMSETQITALYTEATAPGAGGRLRLLKEALATRLGATEMPNFKFRLRDFYHFQRDLTPEQFMAVLNTVKNETAAPYVLADNRLETVRTFLTAAWELKTNPNALNATYARQAAPAAAPR